MKRFKLLSLTLAFALVLTTMFAGAESVFADTAQTDSDKAAIGASLENARLMRAADTSTPSETIAAVNLNTATPKWNPTNSYSYSKPIYAAVSIPKAGNFVFEIWAKGNTAVALYKDLSDVGVNDPVDYTSIPAAQSDDDTYYFTPQVKEAGTYYLVFVGDSYTDTYSDLTIGYVAANKSGGTTTLTSGKTRYASVSGTGYRYFKITTAGTRYLTIKFPWGDGGTSSKYKVKLMNSTKKTNLLKGVVTVDSGRNYVTYAGVPKGTYYVAVSTSTDTCYSINVKATKVTEKSGSTKAKANKISKGGIRYGIITATQSSTSGDWYKFVVGSNQVVNFEVTTLTGGYSGGLKFTFYDSRGAFGTSECYYGEPNKTITPSTQYNGGRLAKGTYWIKVQKYGSGSGYYKLKWK